MNIELETLLHRRVITHCKQLYEDGHYKHAALEAMTQVELALKEKVDVKNKYGVKLIEGLFGERKGIKLHVPFGGEMQEQAETLLKGAFSYYRNYAAHDGSKIDAKTCTRIMILASELLDLIGASSLSFADIGGISGLVQAGVFRDPTDIFKLLCFITKYVIPDDIIDGFYEDLAIEGFTDHQVQAVIETGLVEYITEHPLVQSEGIFPDDEPETISHFELTELGKGTVASLASHAT